MELIALARRLNAEIFQPDGVTLENSEIHGVRPLNTATSDHISFLTQPKALPSAQVSEASAILCQNPREDLHKVQLIHPNPYAAMAYTQQWLTPEQTLRPGVADLACVDATATIAPTATVRALSTVGSHSHIGAKTVVGSNVYIGQNCRIGEGCVIAPHVSIMDDTVIGDRVIIHPNSVLGADGFGFAKDQSGLVKIPQTGHVVIEDDVEIGASCTIDRATFHETRIGCGTKLDSQVHIAHNVTIGAHGVLCGQVGVAGSTTIGDHFTAAGQSAISQGLHITDHVTLGPRSGATKSISEAGEYMGMPTVESRQWMKQAIGIQKLPGILKKIQQLEQKVAHLESTHESNTSGH